MSCRERPPTDGKASSAERRERRSLDLARPDRNRLTPKSPSMSGGCHRRKPRPPAVLHPGCRPLVLQRPPQTPRPCDPDDQKEVTACNWYPAASPHAQRQLDHKSAAHDCNIIQSSHTCISYPIHHFRGSVNSRARHISRTALFRNPTLAWYFPSST
jgi:hypothetical protein